MRHFKAELDEVTAVLLPDGWHDTLCFDVGTFEYRLNEESYPQEEDGIPDHWFELIEEDGNRVYGPMTSIIAVRAIGAQ